MHKLTLSAQGKLTICRSCQVLHCATPFPDNIWKQIPLNFTCNEDVLGLMHPLATILPYFLLRTMCQCKSGERRIRLHDNHINGRKEN